MPQAAGESAWMPDNRSMNEHNVDERWMQRALDLASEAMYLSSPNPRVGCVLTDDAGQIQIGRAHV